jgi:hypothetical protein
MGKRKESALTSAILMFGRAPRGVEMGGNYSRLVALMEPSERGLERAA